MASKPVAPTCSPWQRARQLVQNLIERDMERSDLGSILSALGRYGRQTWKLSRARALSRLPSAMMMARSGAFTVVGSASVSRGRLSLYAEPP